MPTIKYNFDTGAIASVSAPSAIDYTNDFGQKQIFNGVFRAPSDFTVAESTAVVTAAGAAVRIGLNPCPVGTTRPRRLVFVRNNGNSITVPVPVSSPAGIKSYAQLITTAINDAGTPKVVCIALEGEVQQDAIALAAPLVVRPAFQRIAYIEPAEATGKSSIFYTGSATEYVSDATGVTTPVRFKSMTNSIDAIYTGLSSVAAGCIGAVEVDDISCGGPNYLRYRRLEIDFATQRGTEPGVIQTVTIPVKETGAELVSCIQAIAAIIGVVCVRYIGESHARYHIAADIDVASVTPIP